MSSLWLAASVDVALCQLSLFSACTNTVGHYVDVSLSLSLSLSLTLSLSLSLSLSLAVMCMQYTVPSIVDIVHVVVQLYVGRTYAYDV